MENSLTLFDGDIHVSCLGDHLYVTSLHGPFEHVIPSLLRLFFYEMEDHFLSYTHSCHEKSLVLNQRVVHLFPADAIDYEPEDKWRALQVSAAASYNLSQLQVLQLVTGILAKQQISVFQISTYQTDYVLVRDVDMQKSVDALRLWFHENATNEQGDNVLMGKANAAVQLPLHQHILSTPTLELKLFHVEKNVVKQHLYAIIKLLFMRTGSDDDFLSFTITEDGVSLMTSDMNFLEYANSYQSGLVSSPDVWRVIQVGNKKLGFSETGIVASQSNIIASAGSTAFYLSTYSIDFVMIKTDEWECTLGELKKHFQVIEGCFANLTN